MKKVTGFLACCGFCVVLLMPGKEGVGRADEPLGDPIAKPPAEADWRTLPAKELETMVRELLYASKFRLLNDMVAEINEKKLRTADGHMALSNFFIGVGYPRTRDDEEDWKELFGLLLKWKEQSNNIFTAIAIGQTQVNYAWHARTNVPGKDLTPDQANIFADSLEHAEDTLKEALEKPGKCVYIYACLLTVGMGRGWSLDDMKATLDEANKLEPGYYPAFCAMGYYTMERWYGKPGDTTKFMASIPERVPGDRGYETYTRTALDLQQFYSKYFIRQGQLGIVDWPILKKGFEVICRDYPAAVLERNEYAACACLAHDRPTARRLINELSGKNQLVEDAWRRFGGLEANMKWLTSGGVPAHGEDGDEALNLVKNGDFGKGLEGWSVQSYAKKGRAVADPAEQHEKHPSIRIDNSDFDNTYVSQKLAVKPNTRYRLTGWIKTKEVADEHSKSNVGATLWIGGGWEATKPAVRAGEWTYVEFDFDSEKRSEIELGPRLGSWGGKVTGSAWFSEVGLVELEPEKK